MNIRNISRELSQIIPANHKLEIYLRYKDEKDRELFGFEEVSEYFSGKFSKYVIGVVNLERLYYLTGTTWQFGCFYSEYGEKSNLLDPPTPLREGGLMKESYNLIKNKIQQN